MNKTGSWAHPVCVCDFLAFSCQALQMPDNWVLLSSALLGLAICSQHWPQLPMPYLAAFLSLPECWAGFWLVWTHRSVFEAPAFISAWCYWSRCSDVATGSSVSMLTASDTLATPECTFCHTHFVALKGAPGSFPKSSLSGPRISQPFPSRVLVAFQGGWWKSMSAWEVETCVSMDSWTQVWADGVTSRLGGWCESTFRWVVWPSVRLLGVFHAWS